MSDEDLAMMVKLVLQDIDSRDKDFLKDLANEIARRKKDNET
jgi:hypothetical protein